MFPPGVGGAETYAYELANELGDQGHKVDVYTQYQDSRDETVEAHDNVNVYRIVKARKYLVTFETIFYSLLCLHLVNFEKYDLVHGTLMPPSTVAFSFPFISPDIPIILTSHGTSIDEALAVNPNTTADYLLKYFFYPLNIVFDFISAHQADRVIAISEHSRDRLNDYYLVPECKLEVIPHGVDTDCYNPDTKDHHSICSEKISLLYVGRLDPRKGLDLLFKSLPYLDSDDVELLIAGTGRHRDYLEDLAYNLGVSEQVEFLGYVPDEELPSLYASADVFTLPSHYEGFGLVLLEAMASGTPVVSTFAGGNETIVKNGKSGFLITRDSSELSDKVKELTYNEACYRKYSKQARSQAVMMNWKKVSDKTNGIYREILK